MNNDALHNLKKRIMRRIYFLFLLRQTAPFAFDCLVIAALAFAATLFVSFRDVFANLSAASGSGNLSGFSLSAFSETEIETKFLLLVFGAAGFVAFKHLKKAVRAVRMLRDGGKARANPNN